MTKYSRVKESWQTKVDGKMRSDGRRRYGNRKTIEFPHTIAEELAKAAKKQGVSQTRYVVEAVAEKLGFDLESE